MGLFSSSHDADASATPQQPWDGSQMPSQEGRIAIVTGANSGIGYFTARALAEHGAHVVLACRSESKARVALQEMTAYLHDNVPNGVGKVDFLLTLDLSDLASVRGFAETIQHRFPRIDLLVNNGGVTRPPEPLTMDGLESHFGINHVGHFLLTTLLWESLRKAPAARIVHVGSASHAWKPLRDVAQLATNNWWSWDRYGQSKLAQMIFMVELQRRLTAAGITNVVSLAAHPGVTYTAVNDKIVEGIFPQWLQGINKKISASLPLQRADMGALPTLYAATVADLRGMTYIGPSGAGRRSGYPSEDTLAKHVFDEAAARQLWAISEELTMTRFEIK